MEFTFGYKTTLSILAQSLKFSDKHPYPTILYGSPSPPPPEALLSSFSLAVFYIFFVLTVSAGRPPLGQMPFIVTPEGKVLAQSGAIMKYICKKGGRI